ncbi:MULTISPECIES: acyl-CoA dehydrogenase [unclassified Pseudomonas]|uniref:acyl-CoA dehydrogenase n=1 Tax=unclassified Pseudomonas TaxID=196821 RepID=UPI000C869FB7|nr:MULTISPECIES: acyl-CoA dehydrogenase [unclassified Pseudomonas]PMV19253.1 acyl-CoA dehydrogenase [Pseudomonas sp. FW305-3-2-15-C-TSA2]PMV28181.1 acyl-CoA dehydrogenase [Pseudomonas sp. DP16D-L5]PMV35605.1 acyl-CoA dehydrogenase [Pseudomonas sp. FW305-3-2-15-A-LB2]PMV41483.1 acyl-CoA dehydrogenase [Pseudomonas sp. FW305-3-2-15-C-R2A1]PMV44842.1 acyl-CoA dehydrogenase [Pseudomonas sp. FW305-3-2-15-C-LB1]
MLLLWILVLVVGIAYLAHRRVAPLPALGVVAVYLLAMGAWGHAPGWLLLIFWVLIAVVAAPLLLPDLRRQYFTKPLFNWFQKVLPPMSETERDAIDAGTVWWDGELFSGRPDWDKLLAYPKARLTEEEQAFIDGPTEELCAMVSDWEIGQAMDLPPAAWEHIKTHGFFALIIPKEYGGKGFSAYAHSQVAMKLATRSGDLASTVMVPNSLGPAELLLHYGTEEQRNYYLPRLARGDDIPCFALTGPLAGSDAGAMPDTGVICKGEWEGKETLGLRLNWEKRYITLGPVATLLGLAFKAHDPDHLLGDEEDLGISLALIPTDTPGVEIGRRHLPLGAAFMNGPNSGKDVFIPLEFLIGGQEMLGKGWMMLMNCLSVGRSISLPAVGTGAAKFTSLVTGQYAQVREQFNVPLSAFEGIQEALARIGGNAWLMDSARMLTANAVDLGEKPSVLSAILKYHLTERGRECISHAMDVHGGKGIIMGPNNYLGRNWQGAPIFITVEGANILSRNLMIFGQGAIRCHPFVLKEMALAGREDHDQALKEFDSLLMQHIGFAVSNAASTLVLNLGVGHFEKAPGNRLSQGYFRALNRQAAAFALLADLSMMLLGGELKRRERLSARLGDVLSHMYLASAALKRYHDLDSPDHLEPLFAWAMEESLGESERALDELLSNFPNKVLGCLLRVIVFPFGRRHTGPSDALDAEVAAVIGRAKGDPTLEELLAGCYRPQSSEDPVGALQHAYDLLGASHPLQKKLHTALKSGQVKPAAGEHAIDAALHAGVLQPAEAQTLRDAEAARRKVIDVDDFSKEELTQAEGKVR